MQRQVLRTALVVVAVATTLQACGDTGVEAPGVAPEDEAAADETDDDEGDTAGSGAAAPEEPEGSDAPAEEAAAGAPIEVDASALPSTPAGFETIAADVCSLHTVDALDAFFRGAGDLATSGPLDSGCRWAVDGLPRSHYVDIQLTDEATVFAVVEGDRVDIAGTQVHLQRGPSDAYATVPTPDGRYIAIHVYGDYDVELRPLDGGLDPAARALAENLIGRL